MTLPDDGARRPPPSTGRQDRHRPPPASALPEPAPEAARLPPRGAAYYAKGRAHQIGLGCLVVMFIAGAAAALILLLIGLTPSDDFIPAGGVSRGVSVTENPPGGAPAPAGDAPAGAE